MTPGVATLMMEGMSTLIPDTTILDLYNALHDGDNKVMGEMLERIEGSPELTHHFLNSASEYLLEDALNLKAPYWVVAKMAGFGCPDEPNKSRKVWQNLNLRALESKPERTGEEIEEYCQLARVLIDAQIGTENLEGKRWTAVHVIVKNLGAHSTAAAIELLDYMKQSKEGFNLNQVDEVGETPLACAFWELNLALARYLIDNGADVNLKTKGGSSNLSYIFRDTLAAPDRLDQTETILAAVELLQSSGYTVPLEEDKAKIFHDHRNSPVDLAKVGGLFAALEKKQIAEDTPDITVKRSGPRL